MQAAIIDKSKMDLSETWSQRTLDRSNQSLEVYLNDLDTPFLYLTGEGSINTPLLGSQSFPLEQFF